MHQIVYELHMLLDRAGVKPPLVVEGAGQCPLRKVNSHALNKKVTHV